MLVDFLRDNWQYIGYGLVVLIELLILIFRNKKVIIDNSLVSELIPLINDAEKQFKLGDEKKAYVLSEYLKLHPDCVLPVWFICSQIENILTTPQKKR